MDDEKPFLTPDDFNDITSLEDVMTCTKLDRNSVADCVFAVGLRFIELPEKQTILDVFESAGFVKSKGQFKKNLALFITFFWVELPSVVKFFHKIVRCFIVRRDIYTLT